MADQVIARKMEIMAKRAVDHALKTYKVELDFSETSIQKVESILTDIESTFPKGLVGRLFKKGPTEQEIESICNMYGGYIGEIFRQNLGGKWDTTDYFTPGHKIPCINIGLTTVFPPAKVAKRLSEGKGDDVWFYYQAMKAQLKQQAAKDAGGEA
ncbi:MAG: hypothetical protein EPN25_11710 [Nitrospirae bacterium]|nr:MAG: hypothetical protein EPN25_11710 [Nitrospirota bacterium]